MPVVGTPRTFFKRFKFIVSIDNFASSGWEKAGPIEAEAAVIEAWEGGALIATAKDPGRITVPDFTLSRGATRDLDAYNWFKQVADLARNAGEVDPKYKKNADVVQQDRDGKTLARFRLHEAWPRRFKAGDWDNTADENVMEELVLVYRRFERLPA